MNPTHFIILFYFIRSAQSKKYYNLIYKASLQQHKPKAKDIAFEFIEPTGIIHLSFIVQTISLFVANSLPDVRAHVPLTAGVIVP
jgi:hypothetical protein